MICAYDHTHTRSASTVLVPKAMFGQMPASWHSSNSLSLEDHLKGSLGLGNINKAPAITVYNPREGNVLDLHRLPIDVGVS